MGAKKRGPWVDQRDGFGTARRTLCDDCAAVLRKRMHTKPTRYGLPVLAGRCDDCGRVFCACRKPEGCSSECPRRGRSQPVERLTVYVVPAVFVR